MKFKNDIYPWMDRFFQWKTYYGVIEGSPSSAINIDMLNCIKEKTKQYFHLSTIHMIVPEEDSRNCLPKITCIAELTYTPMKDESKEISKLGLIWFQDEFAFPIAEDILEKIQDLDWKALSEDIYL